MKADFSNSIADEIRFLFDDVIKVNVLTHAEAFREHKAHDFVDAVLKTEIFAREVLAVLPQVNPVAYDPKLVSAPQGYPEAWQQLIRSGILQMLIPREYGGKSFPDTVKVAIQEILLSANPSFYLYLMLTLEVASLIDRFGSQSAKDAYCRNLYNGLWTGTFSFTEPLTDSDWEAIEAVAKEADGQYSIHAVKTFTLAGSHDLAENVVHLVLSLIDSPEANKQQLAWFIVPSHSIESDHATTNHVIVESCHDTIGLNGIPFCTMSFGKKGTTKGQLLCKTGTKDNDLYKTLNGVRTQMALQGVALSAQVYRQALEFACRSAKPGIHPQSKSPKLKTVSLISYPHIADHVMYMKSITEGIRAAVYSIAFFNDCSFHGGREQKEFFADLTDLYTGILKVHVTTSGLELIGRGIQVFGKIAYTKDSITERNYRNLQAATLFGGANEIVAQELVDRLVNYKEGSLIDSLIRQFSSVDVNQARSEPMKEAIRVWQDYIGGIIVLVDDLKKGAEASVGNEEVDPRLTNLWASRIVKLMGDVILCYHLISQGLEAEKKLEHLGINFYNLQQDVSREPDAMTWYDRLLSAEYFALNVLAENESNIRIIQRNASSALDAFFSLGAD